MKKSSRVNSRISTEQLVFIIIGAQIATAAFSLPRVVAEEAGQDAWIAVFIGALIPLLSIFLIERLLRRMPDLDFIKVNRYLLGKYAGFLTPLIFIVYAILFESVVVRLFSEITKIYLLPTTPIWVILFLLMSGVVYIISQGIVVIARINELLFFILLPTLLLLIFPLTVADTSNIFPIGEAGFYGIGRGALSTAFAFAGPEVLLVMYYLVDKKDRVLKAGCIAVGITTMTYFMLVISGILVFGADVIKYLTWPVLTMLKVAPVPVAERMEFFFLSLWLGLGVRPAVNLGFAASYSLAALLRIDSEKYFLGIVIAIGIIMYIIALQLKNIIAIFQWVDYMGYIFICMAIGYPVLLLIFSFMRGKRKAKA